MIRLKSFRKAATIPAWFNRPENSRLSILGVVREGVEDIQVIYDEPVGVGTVEDQRTQVLKKRLADHFNYPKSTKRKLLYPKSILDFQVAPLARISNSLRNLRGFRGLGPAELTQWVADNLPDGYQMLSRSRSKEEYGVDVTLIEKRMNDKTQAPT